MAYARTRPKDDPTLNPTQTPTAAPPTTPPTLAPVFQLEDPEMQELLEELREWIAPADEGGLDAFSDRTSAQYKALEWLSKSDSVTATPGRSSTVVVERYALAVLYYATSGNNWQRTARDLSFFSDQSVCEWNSNGSNFTSPDAFGVYCYGSNGKAVVRAK